MSDLGLEPRASGAKPLLLAAATPCWWGAGGKEVLAEGGLHTHGEKLAVLTGFPSLGSINMH